MSQVREWGANATGLTLEAWTKASEVIAVEVETVPRAQWVPGSIVTLPCGWRVLVLGVRRGWWARLISCFQSARRMTR